MSDNGTKKQIDAVWFRKQLDELDEGKPASLSEIRELLLSDEFMTAFAKKFFSTPLPSTIIPGNSAGMICGIDKAKGDSFGVICEWAGKGNEVSE